MENKGKSRVEIFSLEHNGWIINSRHKDEDHAKINADVIAKSRKCRARVITDGLIVYQTPD